MAFVLRLCQGLLLAAVLAAPSQAQGLSDADAGPAPAAPSWSGTPAVLAPAFERSPVPGEARRDFTVIGRVVSSDDRLPLPSVNVVVVGTTIGAATGIDGTYQITAPNETDSLRFTYVGFETQTVPILGRTQINVTLRSEGFEGDEVVVIGYGTREVRDLTGSVGVVTSEEIEGKPLASFEDALAGRVAGVQVQHPLPPKGRILLGPVPLGGVVLKGMLYVPDAAIL